MIKLACSVKSMKETAVDNRRRRMQVISADDFVALSF